MTQSHPGNILRSGSETFLRVLFGVFLAFIAIALATLPNPVPFAAVTVVMALFASREWHRLVRSPAQREIADQQPIHVQTIITAASIACAVTALVLRVEPAAFAFLAIGTVAAFVIAQQRKDNPLWHAGGVLYIGLPSVALVALKTLPTQGTWYILGLFLIVWATDTGALVFGKLIGGKKIAPRISPGKTWAGTIGGSITAATVFAAYIAFFSFNVLVAIVFAIGLSVVAHLGDLFESSIKRHFGTKDTGGLIPGHGGVLDRMDSMFACSCVLAVLVFGLHLNPLFGGHAVKAIAATKIFDELPPLDEVLGRKVTVLGSTGSIGVNTLDVIAHVRKLHGADAMPITALTAGGNVKLLIEQAKAMKPKLAVIGDEKYLAELKAGLAGTGVEAAAGRAAVIDAAGRPSDFVMVAIMGAAAIEPALAAIRRGVVVALANKECVVAAGAVFRDAMEKSGASVLPVDSEHNAIFQVLGSGDASEADLVTITASGGPFREWSLERMRAATVEEAVAHPNWAMGRKISLDSATLMNKGLELIEAHFLFALPPEKLAVVVHPQSIVHCLVSYEDGTTMAHLSAPDMRTPIAHALGWPRRIPSPSRRLDLAALGTLVFHPPAHDRFPALNLAIDSMRSGGMAPTVLNAANEIAVQAFLDRRIGFLDIPRVVAAAMDRDMGSNGLAGDLESVLGTDARARVVAEEICQRVGT